MTMILENSVLAKHKSRVVFSEDYSEKDFDNDCKLFERMIMDLSPDNCDLFAVFYLSHLKKGKVDMVKLIKFKAGLLTNLDNRDWFAKQPKDFLQRLKRKMESMKRRATKK